MMPPNFFLWWLCFLEKNRADMLRWWFGGSA